MYVLQFKKPYLELGPNFNQVLILYPPQWGSAFSCVLGAFSTPVGMLLDCWDMFVMFSITCCWTGEAKPALASSHAVRVMGPEVSDTRSQSTRPAETSSLQSVGQGGGGRLFPLSLCHSLCSVVLSLCREPPPVHVRGSVYCNSNRDTLYQFISESAALNLDTETPGQT